MAKFSLSNWFGVQDLTDCIDDSGATDAEVARALDVSPQTIANWKLGKGQPSVGDVREIITRFGGADEERILYVQEVVRTKKADRPGLEFDPRFNAIMLEKGERHYNYTFKWVPDTIPGVLQTEPFHYLILQPLEGTSDEVSNFGRSFKVRRGTALRARTNPFTAHFIIGEAAISWLKELEAGHRREQIDLLREWNSLPNFDIKIMAGNHTLGGSYELFVPAGSLTAGPKFVFAQIRDRTWCIEDPARVELYHGPIEPNWRRATPLEEYLDAKRDRLA
ncbi:hypothetical protein GCM10009830_40770 [Glycomyces endophyticus]|uniref:Helix-turn-helix transcriptional regulator n=1 Tax=Glycomyces endophyticus TaxID=480996 RepID=A0ABP4TJ50_9ACTN